MNLKPSYVSELDFSKEAKKEWALRDTLLSHLSSGKKDWDKMTSKEKSILEKYGEVYENIWDIVGGGCSWYCGGGTKDVTASSFLKSQGKNNYEPKNAHDLNYKNAWVEGVPGYGKGEYLLYHFSAGPRITEIIIVNGYVKSQAAWKNNSRVKKLKVYHNDKPFAIFNLEDKIANQGFKIEPMGGHADWTLKFEILDVYEGEKYDDVVISEIYFDGIDVHCFAKGTGIQMADNSIKKIEDLRIGDWITNYDLETNTINSSKIEELEKDFHNDLVTYNFTSGMKITATQDHPFLIKGKDWCSFKPIKSEYYKGFDKISKIQIGDLFITPKGTDKLIGIDFLDGKQITYTISKLSNGNNFIANGFVVGVEELNTKRLATLCKSQIGAQCKHKLDDAKF